MHLPGPTPWCSAWHHKRGPERVFWNGCICQKSMNAFCWLHSDGKIEKEMETPCCAFHFSRFFFGPFQWSSLAWFHLSWILSFVYQHNAGMYVLHAQYILLLNPLHTAHISAVGRDCDWKAWNQQPIFTKVPSIVHETKTKTNLRAEKAWWSWVGASWKCNKIYCFGTCPLKSSLLTRDDKGLSVTRGILTDWNRAVRFIAWKRCWSCHIQGQTPCTVKVWMETIYGERLNHSSNLLATCKGCLSFFSITNNQSRMHKFDFLHFKFIHLCSRIGFIN